MRSLPIAAFGNQAGPSPKVGLQGKKRRHQLFSQSTSLAQEASDEPGWVLAFSPREPGWSVEAPIIVLISSQNRSFYLACDKMFYSRPRSFYKMKSCCWFTMLLEHLIPIFVEREQCRNGFDYLPGSAGSNPGLAGFQIVLAGIQRHFSSVEKIPRSAGRSSIDLVEDLCGCYQRQELDPCTHQIT
jgi:hypothetical protein